MKTKILIVVLVLMLLVTIKASAATILWDELCYSGTWGEIHDPYGYEEWVVMCGRFNTTTKQITWLWSVSCNPAYNVYVRILETRQDVARAQCWLR